MCHMAPWGLREKCTLNSALCCSQHRIDSPCRVYRNCKRSEMSVVNWRKYKHLKFTIFKRILVANGSPVILFFIKRVVRHIPSPELHVIFWGIFKSVTKKVMRVVILLQRRDIICSRLADSASRVSFVTHWAMLEDLVMLGITCLATASQNCDENFRWP